MFVVAITASSGRADEFAGTNHELATDIASVRRSFSSLREGNTSMVANLNGQPDPNGNPTYVQRACPNKVDASYCFFDGNERLHHWVKCEEFTQHTSDFWGNSKKVAAVRCITGFLFIQDKQRAYNDWVNAQKLGWRYSNYYNKQIFSSEHCDAEFDRPRHGYNPEIPTSLPADGYLTRETLLIPYYRNTCEYRTLKHSFDVVKKDDMESPDLDATGLTGWGNAIKELEIARENLRGFRMPDDAFSDVGLAGLISEVAKRTRAVQEIEAAYRQAADAQK